MLDVSQAHELKLAFRRTGWTNADIKTLCEGDILRDVLKVVRNQAGIKLSDYLIDCDAAPFIPEGWAVEEHLQGGQFSFSVDKVNLYLSKKQKKTSVVGNDLWEELKDKAVLNANVLDYLLAHPELMPDSWKGKAVFFWGTIYRGAHGRLDVRYLYWDGRQWRWGCSWLGGRFFSNNLAAVASL